MVATRLQLAFWAKVDKRGPDECWPWIGYVRPSSGHGFTSYKSKCVHASRKAWILTHGWPGVNLSVLHRCDNCLCCNPAHMYLGTRADNMIDRWARTPAAERGQRNRSRVLFDTQIDELFVMRANGKTLQQCADHFHVHIATICRYITERKRQKLYAGPVVTTSHAEV